MEIEEVYETESNAVNEFTPEDITECANNFKKNIIPEKSNAVL